MSTRTAIPEAREENRARDGVAPRNGTAIRTAGGWLAAASLLMIAVLALHGPLAPNLGEQMTRIAASPTRWRVAHWLAAAGLSIHAMTGFLVLTAGSRLTASSATLTAWSMISVGALWTLTTAVVEATVVTAAATAGTRETFDAWWAFAEGKATGFAFLALAVALIAGHEAGNPVRATPRWAAQLGALAGVASFSGWALGMWLGVPIGNLLWVVASIGMSLWTLAFGLALARQRV